MAALSGATHILQHVNPAFCQLIKMTKTLVVGRPISQLWPTESGCLALVERVFRTAKPESYTDRDRSDPRSAFGSYTAWPIRERGRIVGVMIQVVEAILLYEKTLAMNEALVLGSLRQHELTAAANLANAARKQAELALSRANEALEAKVIERTRELTEANAKLEAEAEERERVEETLRQSQKMEAIGQLAGGIAHDFNNLLQGIAGSLELMLFRIGQGRTAELDRFVKNAIGSANRAAGLTQRLLAFSRRQTLDPKLIEMNRLVLGMMELFARTVGPGIEFVTQLVDEPWLALCDTNQLENVLLNLVVNSRDAMPYGGTIVIETDNVAIPDSRQHAQEPLFRNIPAGDYVSLAVIDNGTGMAPHIAGRVFDPFFTTKPLGQGTGLGLSMMYGFVQQSGGHVRLLSQEGQGTTMKIYLPRHRGAVGGGSETGGVLELAPATKGGVILVVEDEAAIRVIIVEALSDLGYSVIDAVDGQSAVQVLDSGTPIDLLLTDVGLPGSMNGRQLADQARRQRPGLKVLFITGYVDGADMGRGLTELGMQVITKPFLFNVLAATVAEMIGVVSMGSPGAGEPDLNP